jgi:ribonuclease HI
VQWRWVKGHSGHDANERCDALAVAYCRRAPERLYSGPLLEYPYGSLAPSDAAPLPERKPAAPKLPGTYLSYLDGKLERHGTWKECEARVKGRPAKFKKVTSAAEEAATLKAWGLGS